MTQFTYDVINRPKKDATGVTNISWSAECGREAVDAGGFLITRRVKKDEKRNYHAYLTKGDDNNVDTVVFVGDGFETRAQAAFAIWRKYYEDHRLARASEKAAEEAERVHRRDERARKHAERQTPAGMQAYRDDLNRKARERRANMTKEERAADSVKRRKKRKDENFVSTYHD